MFKVDLDTSKAIERADHLKKVIDNIDFYRAFNISNSQALDSIAAVRSAINAIPDVTYKDLVYRVKTQASPIRPFSEGMEYVRRKLKQFLISGLTKKSYESILSYKEQKLSVVRKYIDKEPVSTIVSTRSVEGRICLL